MLLAQSSAMMDCEQSWRALAVPLNFSPFSASSIKVKQGQVKHNGSLLGTFPISKIVKQECVLAPTLFSIFFSIMLREAKEDMPDGIIHPFPNRG